MKIIRVGTALAIGTAAAAIGVSSAQAGRNVVGARLAVGRSCVVAHDRRYENRGYVCVELAGRYRLEQIVVGPAILPIAPAKR